MTVRTYDMFRKVNGVHNYSMTSSEQTDIKRYMQECLQRDYDGVVNTLSVKHIYCNPTGIQEYVLPFLYMNLQTEPSNQEQPMVLVSGMIYVRKKEDLESFLDFVGKHDSVGKELQELRDLFNEPKQEEKPKKKSKKQLIEEHYTEGNTFMLDPNTAFYVVLNDGSSFRGVSCNILPDDVFSMVFTSVIPTEIYPKSDIDFFDLVSWNVSDYFPFGLKSAIKPS